MGRIGKVLVALSLLTIGSTPGLMKSCGGGGGGGGGGMGHYEANTEGSGRGSAGNGEGTAAVVAAVQVPLR